MTVIDLSTLDGADGFRLDGIDTGDQSGISDSDAGDVNGDGFGDLIIGAPGAATYTGESYVVFGKATGFTAGLALADLDVVAVHPVVAQLQGGDAAAFPFALFQVGQKRVGVLADISQLIQFGVEALGKYATVTNQYRRLFHQRALQ